MSPQLSIIVPVYNEGWRLPTLVEAYRSALQAEFTSWELLLVVNGSRDDSLAVAESLAEVDPRVRALGCQRGGWGRAVKLGLERAQGDFLCYTNGARTEPRDLVLALHYAVVNRAVVVKASRLIRESWLRKVGSSLYNLQYRVLFRVPVWDVNGTPKVLPRQVLRQLPALSGLEDGDLLDAQLVHWCFEAGVGLLEMPVRADRPRQGKSTTSWRSALRMYWGLVRLRWRSVR